MSARSEIFTNKEVKTLKPFFSDYDILHFRYSNRCISGNNEVSLFPSESALSKYLIIRPTIIFKKRVILAWRVTNNVVCSSETISGSYTKIKV